MTPQTLAFISRLFPPDQRRTPIAIWGAAAGVAIILGPVLGGILVQHLSWRWIFLLNLPIGLAGMAIAIVFLPDWRPGGRLRFDAMGAGLASLGLFAVVFGVQNGQHYQWASGILALIGAGLVLLGGFVWWQRRTPTEPLVPPVLFAHNGFGNANLTHAALGFASTGMFLPLVIYLQTVLGLSALRSSLLTLHAVHDRIRHMVARSQVLRNLRKGW